MMTVVTNQRNDEKPLLKAALTVVQMRKLRNVIFPSGMFGEPAWDILLALYSAASKSDRTASRLAECSGAPLSTTLRWLQYLEAEGLVMRDRKNKDPASEQVHLTEQGYSSLETFLSHLMRFGQSIC